MVPEKRTVNLLKGIAPAFLPLIVFLFWGLFQPDFFSGANMLNTVRSFVPFAALAAGMATAVRAGGPDLSLGSILLLSGTAAAQAVSAGLPFAAGGVLAVVLGAAIGAVNGLLIGRLRFPAVWGTLAVCIAVRMINSLFPRRLPVPELAAYAEALLLPLLIGIPLAALLLLVLIPLKGRERHGLRICVPIYAAAAAFAALGGIYLCARTTGVIMDGGIDYEICLIFLAGGLCLGNAAGRKLLPLPAALLLAFSWCTLMNLLTLYCVSSYWQLVLQILLAAVFALAAFFSNKKKQHSMG